MAFKLTIRLSIFAVLTCKGLLRIQQILLKGIIQYFKYASIICGEDHFIYQYWFNTAPPSNFKAYYRIINCIHIAIILPTSWVECVIYFLMAWATFHTGARTWRIMCQFKATGNLGKQLLMLEIGHTWGPYSWEMYHGTFSDLKWAERPQCLCYSKDISTVFLAIRSIGFFLT